MRQGPQETTNNPKISVLLAWGPAVVIAIAIIIILIIIIC